jgi:hypothetical protein
MLSVRLSRARTERHQPFVRNRRKGEHLVRHDYCQNHVHERPQAKTRASSSQERQVSGRDRQILS